MILCYLCTNTTSISAEKPKQLVQLEHATKEATKYGIGFAVSCCDGVLLAKADSLSSESIGTRILDQSLLTSKQSDPSVFDNSRLGAVIVRVTQS